MPIVSFHIFFFEDRGGVGELERPWLDQFGCEFAILLIFRKTELKERKKVIRRRI